MMEAEEVTAMPVIPPGPLSAATPPHKRNMRRSMPETWDYGLSGVVGKGSPSASGPQPGQ
jgi:hypothetical protein